MSQRFYALDAFRGIAALCVVIYHLQVANSVAEFEFFQGGYVFVDFFFVLSGFVLTHGYGFKQEIKFKPFFYARFKRLYPLHLAMLLGYLAFEILRLFVSVGLSYEFNHPPFTGTQALREIIPNALLLQSWLPFADPMSFNAPSWSISVEFFLYLLFFVTLMIGSAPKRVIWLTFAVAALYLTHASSGVLSTKALRGLVGFFAGASTYVLYIQLQRIDLHSKINAKTLTIVGSLLETFCVALVLYVVAVNAGSYNINLTLLFNFVILVFAFEAGLVSRLFNQRFFQFLGDRSYSIYMTHSLFLLLLMSTMMLGQISLAQRAQLFSYTDAGIKQFDFGNVWLNNALVIVILACVLAISNWTYRNIEMRWHKAKPKVAKA